MSSIDPPDPEQPGADDQPQRESPAQHVSARVPESVSRGAFASAAIVVTGGTEFILDFVQNLVTPPVVAARVIIPHATLPRFVEALRKNVSLYEQRFGRPPALPTQPTPERRPSIQSLYDELKIPDDVLGGAYANGVMIAHTVSEFRFDFLSNLIPQSAVSSRVYMSAAQVPRVLESLSRTWQQFQERGQRGQNPPNKPPSTADEAGEE